MIRQAHTYLVGAMGGATLIAIAIAVFVVLVSAQVFRDWPLAALGDGGSEGAGVSKAEPAGTTGPGAGADSSSGPGSPANGAANGGGQTRAELRENGGSVAAGGGIGGAGGGSGDAAAPGDPGGGQGGSGANGSPQATNPSSASGSNGPSGAGSGGKGGGDSGSATSSPSGQVTQTVNETVNKVDETALGGALENSGVTGVTEGVVNGVAGPESTVGKVVDGAADAVGGLLSGNR
ncbi:MAG TPA: hypothetical protein VFR04_00440 [Solirubrobacterales bacterium]|nr:hypothetical protein [Solirubrobacterales bacterium]